VVDVINAALGTAEAFGPEAPPNCRAVEVGASRLQNPGLGYALRIFGRSPRTAACDCERAQEPALPQTLYRMTDPALQAKLQASPRLHRLLESGRSDEEVLEELFLATLTRFPTEEDRRVFRAHRAAMKPWEAARAEQPGKGKEPPGTKGQRTPARKGKGMPDKVPVEVVRPADGRQALFLEVLWALLNTREFILNH
jgi:hypothetical protein